MLFIFTLLPLLVFGALALLASGGLLGAIAGVGASRERPVALQTAFAALCAIIGTMSVNYIVTAVL